MQKVSTKYGKQKGASHFGTEYIYSVQFRQKRGNIGTTLPKPHAMDAQQQAQLQHHLDAIAALLYAEANPTKMTRVSARNKSL